MPPRSNLYYYVEVHILHVNGETYQFNDIGPGWTNLRECREWLNGLGFQKTPGLEYKIRGEGVDHWTGDLVTTYHDRY